MYNHNRVALLNLLCVSPILPTHVGYRGPSCVPGKEKKNVFFELHLKRTKNW